MNNAKTIEEMSPARRQKLVRNVMRNVHQANRVEARLEACGVVIDRRDSEIVVKGNTYPIKAVLKSVGFKWCASGKCWIYTLKQYRNFKMSHGGTRLQNCTVRSLPWPKAWKEQACRALANR